MQISVNVAPTDDKEFQNIIWSKSIKYLQSIPFKPVKCWGKNEININKLISKVNS